jgi:hypothetical protein
MNENEIEQKKTFIKKYWVYIIITTIFLVLAAISIDIWFSNGHVQLEQIRILDGNNSEQTVNTYKFVYEHPILKVVSVFLYSFAMSLMIALFILKVIQKDEDEQRKMEDEQRKIELFKNVFKGVFDRLVPSEIFDVIKKDILEADVVRKNVKWLYDFKVEENQIVLYRNVMYEVHNLGSKECTEPFSYVFSSTDYTETKITFLKWHADGDTENTEIAYDERHHQISDGAHKLEHNKEAGDFEQVRRDIKIPIDKVININFKSKEIYKNNVLFLHETHFTTACSIGWELEVNFPVGYSFGVIPMFVKKLTPIIDDNNRKKYKYDGAILKGQGIEFTLTKIVDNV